MYQLNNIVYLSENENKELLTNELYLTKVIHVDSEKKVPLDEYPFKYTVGVDIDLF